ncbi:MAG: TraU family protein, partial [Duodenibacillus sp.]|nr:TraU family protein [Duodenibacillus sp.]
MRGLKRAIAAAVMAVLSGTGAAACRDAGLLAGKVITDTCWECMLPVVVAGAEASLALPGGSRMSERPEGASRSALCFCRDRLGIAHPGILTALWQPVRWIEFQREPGCSSVLGGVRFPFSRLFQGTDQHAAGQRGEAVNTFRHYRYYAAPLL